MPGIDESSSSAGTQDPDRTSGPNHAVPLRRVRTDLRADSAYLKTVHSQYCSTTDWNIHFLHEGSGKPLIMVHGGGMWLYSFRNNLPQLARQFSVYALDMPGYGYTYPLTSRSHEGLDTMRQTLLSFMDAHSLESATLLGHSWGGGWALSFASCHPLRVERLILIDSSGLDVPDVLEWELLKRPLIGTFLMAFISRRGVRKRLRNSFFQPRLVTEDMVREVYLPLRFSHNRKAQLELARRQSWKETESVLSALAHSTLLVWGRNDHYLDVTLTQRFKGLLTNIRVEILENCGHSSHEEYPAVVNTMVEEFMNS
ncbi:MAG: alpha/beta fold hydrolase [Desulfomonilia bacterium]